MSTNEQNLTPAILWQPSEDKTVRCCLCGFRCDIDEGKLGHCRVRKNINGKLYSLNYDRVCAANADPIEKKPLFHFMPGSASFSIACIGCNFRCAFCQNWQISQPQLTGNLNDGAPVNPKQIVVAAKQNKCKSVAYTYTEPTVFIELAADTALLAKEYNLANVFVSNGYMTLEAVDTMAQWLDGINIDLKSFSDDYYKRLCKARLKPVLDTIKHIAKNTDIWMEITTLIVPEENDSRQELKQIAEFIADSAGPDVPWHISRFIPQYNYLDSYPTPPDTIESAMEIAAEAGLKYVYPGNIPGSKAENTYCPGCRKMLIERSGYRIISNSIENSKCPDCQTEIAGYKL